MKPHSSRSFILVDNGALIPSHSEIIEEVQNCRTSSISESALSSMGNTFNSTNPLAPPMDLKPYANKQNRVKSDRNLPSKFRPSKGEVEMIPQPHNNQRIHAPFSTPVPPQNRSRFPKKYENTFWVRSKYQKQKQKIPAKRTQIFLPQITKNQRTHLISQEQMTLEQEGNLFERDEASVLKKRKKSDQQLIRITLLSQIEERKQKRLKQEQKEKEQQILSQEVEELKRENAKLKRRVEANSKILENFARASSALLDRRSPQIVKVKSLKGQKYNKFILDPPPKEKKKRLTAPQSPFKRERLDRTPVNDLQSSFLNLSPTTRNDGSYNAFLQPPSSVLDDKFYSADTEEMWQTPSREYERWTPGELKATHIMDFTNIPVRNVLGERLKHSHSSNIINSEPRSYFEGAGLNLAHYRFARRQPKITPVQQNYGLPPSLMRGASAGMRLPNLEDPSPPRNRFPHEVFRVKGRKIK